MSHSFQKLRTIVEAALDLPHHQRAAFVREACEGDDELRLQVQRLLEAPVTEMQELLEHRVPRALESGDAPLPSSALSRGSSLGPFEIVESIGRGGTGVVYRARQHLPVERDVAVKVLNLRPDRAQFARRFESEKQVLAHLEHPNVASFYDAGTTEDGLAWFAMELVRGVVITEFVQEQGLDLPARLRLFVSVCGAVDYAHRKGILHRDLKPSNILVAMDEGETVVKVIDFGIARTLEGSAVDLSLMTLEGEALGTPLYMSPEQARGDLRAVDVRSDVFSLGVVLHEILASRVPYRRVEDSILSTLQMVAEGRVTIGATLWNARPIPEDLRAILRVSLDPDPEQRYASARALSDDVGRFLVQRPIEARPPSTLHQLRLIIRRNRATSAVLAVLLLALVTSSIIVTVLYGRQSEALRTAQREKVRFEALNGFQTEVLAFIQHDADLDLDRLREAVDTASRSVLGREVEDPASRADLLDLVAANVATLNQRQTVCELLTRAAQARANALEDMDSRMAPGLRSVLERIELPSNGEPPDPAAETLPRWKSQAVRGQLLKLAETLQALAYQAQALGRFELALVAGREALALHDLVDDENLAHESFVLKVLGEAARGAGNLPTATMYHSRSVELDRTIFGVKSARYATGAHLLGRLQASRLNWADSKVWLARAVSTARELASVDEPRPLDVHNLRELLCDLGRVSMGLGEVDSAGVYLTEALSLGRDETSRRDIAYASVLVALVDLDLVRGRASEAVDAAEEAIRICRNYPEDGLPQVRSWLALGRAQLVSGRDSAAERSHSRALELIAAHSLAASMDEAEAYAGRGWARIRMGRSADAVEDLRRAIRLRGDRLGPDHWWVVATEALHEVASAHQAGGRPDLSSELPLLRQRHVPPLGPMLLAEFESSGSSRRSED